MSYDGGRLNDGVSPTDFGFTDQRQEVGVGLYDYKTRHYDPFLGQFVSPDTIVPKLENPQSLNRYSYVFNNPLKYIDPSGHCPPSICRDQHGRPSDPYYRWGDRDYSTITVNGLNPWFVPQPGDGETPSLKETIRNVEYALFPEAWHDELAAHHEWADRWGPLIEQGLSTAMMGGGGLPARAQLLDDAILAHTRATQLQNQLSKRTSGSVTMGVGVARNSKGTRYVLVGTSEGNYLRKRHLTLNEGEVFVGGSDALHAEQNIIRYAEENGLQLSAVGAGRSICGSCEAEIVLRAGAIPASPTRSGNVYLPKLWKD